MSNGTGPPDDGWREAGRRFRGVVGVAVSWLRHNRRRSALSVVGIALAVVLLVSLVGVGYGAMTFGNDGFSALNRELWASPEGPAIRPGAVGGVRNPVVDAHDTARRMASTEGVADADALAFQAVYVSTDGEAFDTAVAIGITGRAAEFRYAEGGPFSTRDVHYANGSYDGPMTHEVVVSRTFADRYDLAVNNTLNVGGTLSAARANEFTVVGISSSTSRFLGTPTLSLHLSELQEVSGATGRDRATLVAIDLEDSARTATVQSRLEARFPGYRVRTNGEQLRATLGRQVSVLATGVVLVLLGILGSLALVSTSLALLVTHQTPSLSALFALGVRRRTLSLAVLLQGLLLGLVGGLLGCLLAIPALDGIGAVATATAGFDDIVRTPPWVFAVGFGVAVLTGAASASAAAWRLLQVDPLDGLPR